MINSTLTHRCSIRRAVVDVSTGAPTSNWLGIANAVPCFISLDEQTMDPAWTREQEQAAAMSGTALFAPHADVKPGDQLILSRPAPGLTFTVGQAVRPVMDGFRVHHLEAAVTQTNLVAA